MKKFPKLHIFLGAGGVGKTTLSASFALSLAHSGRKVCLLSIDPAKRLQSALGMRLDKENTLVPLENTKGELRVSMLHLDQTLRRWIEQKNMSPEKIQKLLSNPYYSALSEKLASSLDTLAAIFIAEWLEQIPDMDDLIIDTAPGLHAIDFVAKPEKLSLFLDSKLVEWLKIFVNDNKLNKGNIITRVLKSSAKKILEGLSYVGGQNFLVNFGEFLVLLDQVFITAVERLKIAKAWIFHPSTNIILVTAVRDDAASVAQHFAQMLESLHLAPSLAIINKAFPESICQKESFQKFLLQKYEKNSSQDLLANYFSSYTKTQIKVQADLAAFAKKVIQIPTSVDLDKNQQMRLSDLASLGEIMIQAMRLSVE
jgi:anion-transporting  ArsA/GET3 family ATPase